MKTLILSIALLLMLCTCLTIYGADEFGDYSCELCGWSEGNYTIPRQLLVLRHQHPSSNSFFYGLQYVDILFMYQRDILDRIDKVKGGNVATILDCTLKLNDSQKRKILDYRIACQTDPGFSEDIFKPFYETNCQNYNRIAVQFERNGLQDQAEDIYRKVLRECSNFQGCFREAEISLQNLRNQK
jgi:hypothetical protein